MNVSYANYVYPVLTAGLQYKARLLRGEPLDFDSTQRELVRLLDQRVDDDIRTDVLGDGQAWLGLRYALACWLDEIFIEDDSPWAADWRRRALEFMLFRSAVGGRQFAAQSQMALRTRNSDVVETFFLCWMLGFRGNLRENVAELSQEHAEPARRTVARALNKPFEVPPKREARSYVPPLSGREGLHRMILAWLLTVVPLAIVIVVAFVMSAR